MRRNVFVKISPNVVCALAVMFASNSSFAQPQRSPIQPEPRDVSWAPPTNSEPSRPYLSESSRRTSGSGSGTEGTTPILHESAKLTASDAAAGDTFGISVCVSGDKALVGARTAGCTVGDNCGAAYVYRFNGTGWAEEQKLIASDAAAGDKFGFSVSVSGNAALVGAFRDDCGPNPSCGSSYVYRFDGTDWVEEQRLTASDAAAFDEFGRSVSLSGNTAVIGAWNDYCEALPSCGSTYVYRFNGTDWVEEQKLTASDAAPRDNFGSSVSVSGDTVMVGAVKDDCAAGGFSSDCGSVYVFRFNGVFWAEKQKLTASDEVGDEGFGTSVSVSANTAVVGANKDDCTAGEQCGSAYIFRFNGTDWVEEQRLTASDATAHDWFGTSVSISGNIVVVGAEGDGCPGSSNCGAAYVYRFDGNSWAEQLKLTASDEGDFASLGFSISASGNTAMVGAYLDDCASGESCGSVYVFDVSRPADSDHDGDVDISDFASFQIHFTGDLSNFVSFHTQFAGPK